MLDFFGDLGIQDFRANLGTDRIKGIDQQSIRGTVGHIELIVGDHAVVWFTEIIDQDFFCLETDQFPRRE